MFNISYWQIKMYVEVKILTTIIKIGKWIYCLFILTYDYNSRIKKIMYCLVLSITISLGMEMWHRRYCELRLWLCDSRCNVTWRGSEVTVNRMWSRCGRCRVTCDATLWRQNETKEWKECHLIRFSYWLRH